MSVTYIHDGSFKGFLTALALALREKAGGCAISAEAPAQAGLFAELRETGTDAAEASGLMAFIEARGSEGSGRRVRLCYLSGEQDAGAAALEYVRLLAEKGPAADNMLADDRVKRVRDISRKVAGEAERFKGFARFRELADRTLYAGLEPDHDILPLIAPHFRARLGKFNWVLHDAKRGKAAFHLNGRLACAPVTPAQALEFDGKEEAVQALWKCFFTASAIKERLNPGLQRAFVPLKYRKNLTEFDGGR